MSATGTQIAKLYESIASFQTELNTITERHSVEISELSTKHQQELLTHNAKLEDARKEFASYLSEVGVDSFLPLTQPKKTGKKVNSTGAKTNKPRTSSEDKRAAIDRNKAIYTSSYERGLNDKTGLPNKHKGRGKKNDEIVRLMKQDEEVFEQANK